MPGYLGWRLGATYSCEALGQHGGYQCAGDQPFLQPEVVTAIIDEFGRLNYVPAVITPVTIVDVLSSTIRRCSY